MFALGSPSEKNDKSVRHACVTCSIQTTRLNNLTCAAKSRVEPFSAERIASGGTW